MAQENSFVTRPKKVNAGKIQADYSANLEVNVVNFLLIRIRIIPWTR